MVTVVYRVVTKRNKEKEFKNIALQCVSCARKSKECVKYTFFQALDNPREYLVYYRFSSLQGQTKHIENLRKILGPSPLGRDLPKKFIDLLEDEEVVLFNQ